MTTHQLERIKALYREMPGALMPPRVDGEAMWGNVEDTIHWRFCEGIVRMTDEAIGRAVNALASAHNLV